MPKNLLTDDELKGLVNGLIELVDGDGDEVLSAAELRAAVDGPKLDEAIALVQAPRLVDPLAPGAFSASARGLPPPARPIRRGRSADAGASCRRDGCRRLASAFFLLPGGPSILGASLRHG